MRAALSSSLKRPSPCPLSVLPFFFPLEVWSPNTPEHFSSHRMRSPLFTYSGGRTRDDAPSAVYVLFRRT